MRRLPDEIPVDKLRAFLEPWARRYGDTSDGIEQLARDAKVRVRTIRAIVRGGTSKRSRSTKRTGSSLPRLVLAHGRARRPVRGPSAVDRGGGSHLRRRKRAGGRAGGGVGVVLLERCSLRSDLPGRVFSGTLSIR